jgi:hypothetical protein
MFENRARYLANPEHHGVLRGGLDGDQDLLQEELDLMRKHSTMSLERFRAIENEMKRGAFAFWSMRKEHYRRQKNEIRVQA